MISQDRVEKAIRYLAETDEPYAAAKARVKRLGLLEKSVHGQAYLSLESGTVEARKAQAYTSAEWKQFVDDFEAAVSEAERLGAKRDTEKTVIELWRSVNANRRQAS